MKLGKAINIMRRAKGLQLGELARRAEITSGFLSAIERGKKEPSLSVLRALADGLDVPTDLLIAVSQPGEGTLKTSEKRGQDLAETLSQFDAIEEKLRAQLSRN